MSAAQVHPDLIPLFPENIPHRLQVRDQWVCWRLTARDDGTFSKQPLNARTGSLASTTNPGTWSTFDQAVDAMPGMDGIGYVFASDDPFVGIDLDHVQDDPRAGALIRQFKTYAEHSPSGTGVHLIVEGTLPTDGSGRRSGTTELYQHSRFFTMTGARLDHAPTEPQRCDVALTDLWTRLFPPTPDPGPQVVDTGSGSRTDDEIVERAMNARNGAKFRALYATGSVAEHRGDDSAADLALLSILAFWTQDRAQLERLFSRSALGQRGKWKRVDYRERTIDRALDRTEHYAGSTGGDTISGNSAITSAVVITPDFPLHVLPEAMSDYIDAARRSVGVPAEMIALPMLAMFGGVLGNRLCIQLKRGYKQYATLWVAIIAEVGTAKSPALAMARWPLDTLQAESHDAYTEQHAMWEVEIDRWNAAKGETRGAKPPKPTLRHYFSTNLTLEALVSILGSNPGVCVIRDELAAFLRSMDQYRSGGKGSDRQEYLSLHAGAPIKYDRRTEGSVYVSTPVAAIAGGIQPAIAPQLLGRVNERDGMLERFIPIVPTIGRRRWTDDDVDPSLLAPVVEIVRKLDRLSPKDGERGVFAVQLDIEARPIWASWYNLNADAQEEATGLLASYYSKLPNHVARIALILNAIWQDDPKVTISAEMLERAIELGEFIRTHIVKAVPLFGERAQSTRTGIHSRILRILRAGGELDAKGWVQRGVILQRLSNVATDDFQASAEYLESQGTIEHRRDPDSRTKPAEQWRIASMVRDEDAKNRKNLWVYAHLWGDSSDSSDSSRGVEHEQRPEPTPIRPEPLPPTGTEDADEWIF